MKKSVSVIKVSTRIMMSIELKRSSPVLFKTDFKPSTFHRRHFIAIDWSSSYSAISLSWSVWLESERALLAPICG